MKYLNKSDDKNFTQFLIFLAVSRKKVRNLEIYQEFVTKNMISEYECFGIFLIIYTFHNIYWKLKVLPV